MLSFLRPAMPSKTRRHHLNPISCSDGSSVQFHPQTTRSSSTSTSSSSSSAPFSMTHTLPPTDQTTGEPSLLQPPPHYHTYQTEQFRVRAGTAHFFLGLGKGAVEPVRKVSAPTSTSAAAAAAASTSKSEPIPPVDADDELIHIPVRTQHHFINPSTTTPLVIDVHLTPQDYQATQKFFRNFFGYLDDCRLSHQSPSIFQIMVFLHASGTPIAVPVMGAALLGYVGEVLAFGVSWAVTAGLATWGGWVLGYRDTYDEYYIEEEGKEGEREGKGKQD